MRVKFAIMPSAVLLQPFFLLWQNIVSQMAFFYIIWMITTGIPRFTLLMWGDTKKWGSKNRGNRGYFVVLLRRGK